MIVPQRVKLFISLYYLPKIAKYFTFFSFFPLPRVALKPASMLEYRPMGEGPAGRGLSRWLVGPLTTGNTKVNCLER